MQAYIPRFVVGNVIEVQGNRGLILSREFRKYIQRKSAWKLKRELLFQLLTTRCRREHLPEYGYFQPRDIERILVQAEANTKQLMPFFIDIDHLGNYRNEYLGLIDLAIYRALLSEHIEKDYAISLVADSLWLAALHLQSSPLLAMGKVFMRLSSKTPTDHLEKVLNWVMKTRVGPPGYRVNVHRENDVFHLDYSSCLVHDFYKQFGEEELQFFRRTWCTSDFATAEMLVDGGKCERAHTLSDGDGVCDMRWFVKSRNLSDSA
ncbi:MAG: hypothetical protein C4K47_09820 [Candidatus Thorarchaeota archaeon]|nr:MAG: hypothetical protein C4K47_09820 [Candidatus Thorarchaeota archaeon]